MELAKRPPQFPSNPTPTQLRCLVSQNTYLASLARTGSRGASCIEANVSISTVEAWHRKDMFGFQERDDEAKELFLGRCEAEIARRGIDGIEKPIYWKGVRVDTVKEYSDNLLMFRTKRLDAAYKDNYVPQPTQGANVTQINIHLHPSVQNQQSLVGDAVIDAEAPES